MKRTRQSLDRVLERAESACFVAMDFAAKFDTVYDDVYAPVIQDSGLQPIRSDLLLSAAGNVMDEIVRVIQLVRIVLIDITGLNPNVLIELGIAQALQKPIVLLTQDSAIPFDIQPKRVIRYELSTRGRRALRAALQATLQSSVYPAEESLRKMFPLGTDSSLLVLHGSASDRHIAEVYPPVDEAYRRALYRRSSETTGLWDIALALQRVANSRGLHEFRMDAADAARVDWTVLRSGHIISLGGPGANPMFAKIAEHLATRFSNALSMSRFEVDGLNRYRVTRNGTVFPPDQDALLEAGVDFGILMRVRNPERDDAYLYVIAGIRAYGTQGAIRALVTPSLIEDIFHRAGEATQFAALIRTRFDPVEAEALDWTIDSVEALVPC